MTAHDRHQGDGMPQNDGMRLGDGTDALMAALLDEPLPARARQDPEFTAARDAAAADIAVLREQLGLIGDALADAGEHREAGSGAGSPVTPLPARPRRTRRPLRIALGALVAAAAATVVVGTGWLVTQTGGGASEASGDKAAADASSAEQSAGAAFGSPRYLACARLVAEGTVAAVEPVPGTGPGEGAGQERVTLTATRLYQPEKDARGGDDEIVLLREADGHPPLHEGDRVLFGLPREGAVPDTVIVGEEAIAPERARITAALPVSRTLTCE
ncbi:hypothetical protein ACFWH4_19075 [Streptomyces sp. NPDC127091]|uniref:hypothetical protein n=1 Tax=Streptomyces sp. NPDC127091 TaxID=3347134 RepID=UPI00365B420C